MYFKSRTGELPNTHLYSDVGRETNSVKREGCECSFPGLALLQQTVQLVHRQAVQGQVVVGVAQLHVAKNKDEPNIHIQWQLNNEI